MSANIEYTVAAKADLREIIVFYAQTRDEDSATLLIASIIDEIEALADSPMLSNPVAGLPPQYRRWLIFKKRYIVYFERITQDSIRVIRVYGAKRKPLNIFEILGKN